MPLYGVATAVPPAPPPANPARVADQVAIAAPAPEPVAKVVPICSAPVDVAQFAPPPLATSPRSCAGGDRGIRAATATSPGRNIRAAAAGAVAADYAPPKPRLAKASFTRAASEQRKVAKLHRASLRRSASLRRGGSTAVVQLGAYGSPQRVLTAWNAASRRYSALRAYAPMSAALRQRQGQGLPPVGRAVSPTRPKPAHLCNSMRRSGGSCFVRTRCGRRAGAVRLALGERGALDHQVEARHAHRDPHFDLKRDQRTLRIVGDRIGRSRRRGSSARGASPPPRARPSQGARRSARSARDIRPEHRPDPLRAARAGPAASSPRRRPRSPRRRSSRRHPPGSNSGGPASRTSAPSRSSSLAFDRATRLWRMSPQIATLSPAMRPKRWRIVAASSSAWVGCSLVPSPALITGAATISATSLVDPLLE